MPASPALPSSTDRAATFAHVVPLVVFLLFTELARWLKIENAALPWYQSAPEHWVYPLQCVVVGALLIAFRRHYVLAPWRGLPLAIIFAALGIALWILPSWFAVEHPAMWQEWLGMVPRTEGFNPSIFDDTTRGEGSWTAIKRSEIPRWLWNLSDHSTHWWLTVLLRFARMVLIVPFVEELFWRGFLMRYVQAKGKSWQRVPFGQHTWRSFWIVTLLVALIHSTPDRPAAFVWGALVYLVALRTRSLGACVTMHAVGNLLLGIYVILTQQWGFW